MLQTTFRGLRHLELLYAHNRKDFPWLNLVMSDTSGICVISWNLVCTKFYPYEFSHFEFDHVTILGITIPWVPICTQSPNVFHILSLIILETCCRESYLSRKDLQPEYSIVFLSVGVFDYFWPYSKHCSGHLEFHLLSDFQGIFPGKVLLFFAVRVLACQGQQHFTGKTSGGLKLGARRARKGVRKINPIAPTSKNLYFCMLNLRHEFSMLLLHNGFRLVSVHRISKNAGVCKAFGAQVLKITRFAVFSVHCPSTFSKPLGHCLFINSMFWS